MERMVNAELDDIDEDQEESMSVNKEDDGRNGNTKERPQSDRTAIQTRPTAPSRQLTHRYIKTRISEVKDAERPGVSGEEQ